MRTMKVYRRIENYDLIESENPVILSIGNFDGVHRGHQEIIRKLKAKSKKTKQKTCILTFDPHPKKILFNPDFRVLQEFEEKCMALSLLKIDILISHPFDLKFSQIKSAEFVEAIIKRRLNASHIVLGKDFTCGVKEEGACEDVKELFEKFGIEYTVVPPFEHENTEVHSSSIRRLIENGRVLEANKFLFSIYSLAGQVIHGKKRGAELGFPTINFYNDIKVMPAKGVYFTRVLYGGEYLDSITNIGTCPTFGSDKIRIETYILDFNKDIYGEYVQLFFYKKHRNEEKFASRAALSEEIRKDVEARREYTVEE